MGCRLEICRLIFALWNPFPFHQSLASKAKRRNCWELTSHTTYAVHSFIWFPILTDLLKIPTFRSTAGRLWVPVTRWDSSPSITQVYLSLSSPFQFLSQTEFRSATEPQWGILYCLTTCWAQGYWLPWLCGLRLWCTITAKSIICSSRAFTMRLQTIRALVLNTTIHLPYAPYSICHFLCCRYYFVS